MADATVFNLQDGEKAERKLLVTAVDVSETESPEWEIVGVGVEDSAIEYNPDTETKTDILGVTSTVINKLETSQSLEPMTVIGGSKLQVKLYNQVKRQKLSELAMYDIMIIYGYVGSTGTLEAEVHANCTIIPQSVGGSSTADMPININYSNDKTHGTVDKLTGEITFTKEVVI